MNPWYCFSVKSSLLTRLFLHRAALQRWTPNGHNLIKFKILSFCLNTESKLKSVLFNRPHPLWIKCMQTKLFSPALHRQWSHPFSTTHRGILITKKQISFAVTQVFNNKKKKKKLHQALLPHLCTAPKPRADSDFSYKWLKPNYKVARWLCHICFSLLFHCIPMTLHKIQTVSW